MKTWRERIAEARTRGRFTAEDRQAWCGPLTCLVGETINRVFGRYTPLLWCQVNWTDYGTFRFSRGSGFNDGLLHALNENDFDFVESRLDAIEDRALQLKREAS